MSLQTIRDYAKSLRGDRGARRAWDAVADGLEAVPGGDASFERFEAALKRQVEYFDDSNARLDAMEAQIQELRDLSGLGEQSSPVIPDSSGNGHDAAATSGENGATVEVSIGQNGATPDPPGSHNKQEPEDEKKGKKKRK
jgi:hypothetical protein